MPATMTEIARRLNVSQATVSYVLNNRKGARVGNEMRARILDTARQMGYRPNRAARALASGRTATISVVTSLSHFSLHVINTLREILWKDGYDVLIAQTAPEQCSERNTDGMRDVWPVDGMLGLDMTATVREISSIYRLPDVPMVSFGTYYHTDIDHVGVDLLPAMEDSMAHLVETGHCDILETGNESWRIKTRNAPSN